MRAEGAIGPAASLGIPNFRWLWLGTVFSSIGQWMQQVVLGWVVYDLTGSGTILGGVNGVRSVAMLGFGPFAGVFIDRADAKRVMVVVSLFLMALSALMGVLLFTDLIEVWHIFLFMFAFGLAQVLDQPLRATMTFLLVPPRLAPNAMALNTAAMSSTRALGPGVGGALLPLIGAAGAFFAQAASYLFATLTRFMIAFPEREQAQRRDSPLQNLKDGVHFVATARYTRAFLLLNLTAPVLLIPIFTALTPIYAKDVFESNETGLGLLVAMVGVGGVLGAATVAALGSFERRGLLEIVALFGFSAGLFGFSFAAELWQGLLLMLFTGFAEQVFLLTNMTMLQLTVPNRMRGRVSSLMMLGFGLMPIGALAAGAGSDAIGPQAITRIMAGAGGLIAVLLLLAAPIVRNATLSHMMRLHAEANEDAGQTAPAEA
ncbi:MAG: MFS transporter [Chloroflexota bacterium]|nr:MFS transporter [Chloroflexota bacterium]